MPAQGQGQLSGRVLGGEGAALEDALTCCPPPICTRSPPAPFCSQPMPSYPTGESNMNMMVPEGMGSSFPR